MKTLTKVSLVALSAVAVLGLAAPTHAYFYQYQTQPQYYAPQYQSPYYQSYAPQYAPQYQAQYSGYSYYSQPYQFANYTPPGYDDVSRLIQGTLNWVGYQQYIPTPVHQYFYQYYSPYSYYGW